MRAVLVLSLALPLAAQHAAAPDARKSHPFLGDPQAIAAGKLLYATACAGCHGPDGHGGRGPNLIDRGAWHPLSPEDLFATIRNGIPGADMPPLKLPDERLWQIVAYVRSLTAPAIESPPPGNVQAGEALFWGKAQCGSCHRIRGRGGLLGPDLSNIGALRPAEKIRQAILDPDADGFRGYTPVRAVLADGRTLSGVARNRTNYSIQILDEQGELHLLDTAGLRALELGRHSPMPRDYGARLTPEEVTHLVAFLARQSMRPPQPETKSPDSERNP